VEFTTPHRAPKLKGNRRGRLAMHTFRKYLAVFKQLAKEEAQDLVEYSLIVALIAFSTTAGVGKLANGVDKSIMKIDKALTKTIKQALN
jgi:pilus assembly protein Flp/PilA